VRQQARSDALTGAWRGPKGVLPGNAGAILSRIAFGF